MDAGRVWWSMHVRLAGSLDAQDILIFNLGFEPRPEMCIFYFEDLKLDPRCIISVLGGLEKVQDVQVLLWG